MQITHKVHINTGYKLQICVNRSQKLPAILPVGEHIAFVFYTGNTVDVAMSGSEYLVLVVLVDCALLRVLGSIVPE